MRQPTLDQAVSALTLIKVRSSGDGLVFGSIPVAIVLLSPVLEANTRFHKSEFFMSDREFNSIYLICNVVFHRLGNRWFRGNDVQSKRITLWAKSTKRRYFRAALEYWQMQKPLFEKEIWRATLKYDPHFNTSLQRVLIKFLIGLNELVASTAQG